MKCDWKMCLYKYIISYKKNIKVIETRKKYGNYRSKKFSKNI